MTQEVPRSEPLDTASHPCPHHKPYLGGRCYEKEFVKSSNYPVGIFGLRVVSGTFAEEGPKSGGLCPIQFADNIRNENNLCWRMLQYPGNLFIACRVGLCSNCCIEERQQESGEIASRCMGEQKLLSQNAPRRENGDCPLLRLPPLECRRHIIKHLAA